MLGPAREERIAHARHVGTGQTVLLFSTIFAVSIMAVNIICGAILTTKDTWCNENKEEHSVLGLYHWATIAAPLLLCVSALASLSLSYLCRPSTLHPQPNNRQPLMPRILGLGYFGSWLTAMVGNLAAFHALTREQECTTSDSLATTGWIFNAAALGTFFSTVTANILYSRSTTPPSSQNDIELEAMPPASPAADSPHHTAPSQWSAERASAHSLSNGASLY